MVSTHMLQSIKVDLKPREVSQNLLKTIENRRVREVLEKRFGLKTGTKQTLESIGKEYGITRERVRQIEADGLRALATPAVYGMAESVFKALEDHLKEHGGIAAEDHFLASISEKKNHPHLQFLLTVGKQFQKAPEGDHARPTWYTAKEAKQAVEKTLATVHRELNETKAPISKQEVLSMIKNTAERVMGTRPRDHQVSNYLGISKQIGENPYGEYGLTDWPTIRPKGVRDKAYLVLQKAAKPLHFREVAGAINAIGWGKRAAHPQTVHNELIKSSDLFVLVGRGLYALREWGYTPGTVADVMRDVIKNAGHPLSREEIVKKVLDKRFVKENTILLNLQNRGLFTRTGEGKYFLV